VTPIAPNTTTAAVSCRGLVKRYPDVLAVDGLDLDVLPGECFGLLGPNGAGKTTTVEMLEGLTTPDAGTITLLGEQWGRGRDRRLRQQVGVALQETKLSEKLTVRETVRLFRSFFEQGRDIEDVIDVAGLQEKRSARVGKLSGGQKQRLALACALVGAPKLLFLDEPTTGLDPQARLHVWELVEQFKAQGGTVILTTHYMEEAARLCDRVAIVDHGRIIAQDTPAALIASLGASQIVTFTVDGDPGDGVLAESALRRTARRALGVAPAGGLGAERGPGRRHAAGDHRAAGIARAAHGQPQYAPGHARGCLRAPDREGPA
jgi:ABC-2 type transport system ATP-binding protein